MVALKVSDLVARKEVRWGVAKAAMSAELWVARSAVLMDFHLVALRAVQSAVMKAVALACLMAAK